jgi:hypothetical protein
MVGAWTAHSLEYLRVAGAEQFPNALSRSAHLYMGPFGVLLAVLGGGALLGSARLARRLDRRIAHLRGSGGDTPVRTVDRTPGSGVPLRLPSTIGVLATSQLCVYLVQESLEARAIGLPIPGLGALTGVHAWAGAIHLLVASLTGVVLWAVCRHIGRLVAKVRREEARLLARCRRPRLALALVAPSLHVVTPLERWGSQLWSRPPPLAA